MLYTKMTPLSLEDGAIIMPTAMLFPSQSSTDDILCRLMGESAILCDRWGAIL